jgi:hypothetical protein
VGTCAQNLFLGYRLFRTCPELLNYTNKITTSFCAGVDRLPSKWYALCCKPNKEYLIWQKLIAMGYEVFYPQVMKVTKNGRKIPGKPFFPGYPFLRLDTDEESISKFQWTDHPMGLVCIDGKPFHIPEVIISAMQNRLFEINTALRTPTSQGEGTISSDRPEDYVSIRDITEELCADEQWSYALLEMLTKFSTTLEEGIC